MASRKEERAALRRRRVEVEQRERREERRRQRIGFGLAALIAAPIVVGLLVQIVSAGGGSSSAAHIDTNSGATNGTPEDGRTGTAPTRVWDANLKRAAAQAGCELHLGLTDEGCSHLQEGASAPKYGTHPPTSGNHLPLPQADGAYSQTPAPINAVHSLEHGRVEIQYASGLPEAKQLALKGVFDESPGGVLLFPNSKLPYEVAESAWTNFISCTGYRGAKTLDALRAFREAFRGKGPEATPINSSA